VEAVAAVAAVAAAGPAITKLFELSAAAISHLRAGKNGRGWPEEMNYLVMNGLSPIELSLLFSLLSKVLGNKKRSGI